MFNNIDDDFESICKRNKIKWVNIKKENRNSLLQIGTHNGKNVYFRKIISMANKDFEILEKYSKNDENFTIYKYQNEILDNEYTVWKEILLLQMIQKFHKEQNSNLFIHFYTSFIRQEDGRPFMNFLFDFYTLTLKEFIYFNNILFTKHNLSIMFQIFLQGYYLDKMNIHHNDLHWNNIMVKELKKKEMIDIPNFKKRISVEKLFIIIDYGFVTIDKTKSNFEEFKRFFQNLSYFSVNLEKFKSYNDVFLFVSKKISFSI